MSEIQKSATSFEKIRRTDERGEYWSARELQPLLGYVEWRRFEDSIERAMAAAENSGIAAQDHFGGADKMIQVGKGAMRVVADYRLTRYAAYLVAMNGDPRKPEIAAAQTYFAVKTREAELAVEQQVPRSLPEALRAYALELEAHEQTRAELEQARPDADAFRTLAAAPGDYSVREAAYVLNRDPNISTGQGRLFRALREFGVIDARNRPYATHERHARLRIRSYTNPRTQETALAEPQVRITVEGLRYLHRRLGGVASLDFQQPLPFED